MVLLGCVVAFSCSCAGCGNKAEIVSDRQKTLRGAARDTGTQEAISEHHVTNQPPKGFVALFNGNDLAGWKGLVGNPVTRAKMSAEELAKVQAKADEVMRKHWQVVDGVLTFDGKGDSLCTVKEYGDFELLVDWKIKSGGDSGIYLRGYPQVQIWDSAQGSGGLYNNKKAPRKPLKRADSPIGWWNTFRVIMIGQRVTVCLNSVLVVDNVVLENYWEPNKPICHVGQIELQSHSSPLYFRNIFIREIPRCKLLFNGKDLTGWQQIGGRDGSWKVKGGILCAEKGGGGWLSTAKEYDNFQLELEFCVPPGGNSGVFLRAPHEGNPAHAGMEIQLLDDYAEKYAKLQPCQYTGSLYGAEAPAKRVSKKADEWQKMTIVCDGPRVQVTLNDVLIVDANLKEHTDKLATYPGLERSKGYIGLQNHGSQFEYRNIKITELK